MECLIVYLDCGVLRVFVYLIVECQECLIVYLDCRVLVECLIVYLDCGVLRVFDCIP